jgi:hypothetical protein
MGLIAYFGIKGEEADKVAARKSGPPEAVLIEQYKAPQPARLFTEVTLLAQLDVKKTIVVLRDTKLGEDAPDNFIAHVIPLYAVTAKAREGQPAYGSLIFRRKMQNVDVAAMRVVQGGFAPIVRINGKVETGLANDGEEALRNGPRMITDAVHVEAFMDGRENALTVFEDAVEALIAFLVIAVGFLLWGLWRRGRKFKKWASEEADRRYGLPDWNER